MSKRSEWYEQGEYLWSGLPMELMCKSHLIDAIKYAYEHGVPDYKILELTEVLQLRLLDDLLTDES